MADVTAIVDNSTMTRTKLKNWLRIDASDTFLDDLLDLALLAAKESADTYIQDETLTTVPATVEMWILGVVSLWWERKSPFILSSEYKDLGKIEFDFNYDDYFHVLKPFRVEPGFGGW